jgi:uncharacterized membrane protein
MTTPFWLSHHRKEDLHRCLRIGTFDLCARCTGTYPTLVAFLILQFATVTPLAHTLDALSIILVMPATLDWAAGQFHPAYFSNAWRVATGILLGAGLSRSLYIHVQHPFPRLLIFQLGFIFVVASLVFLVRYAKSKKV